MTKHKKYLTEEERLAAKRESKRKWREANKIKIAEYYKQWREANREKRLEYNKQWYVANMDKKLEYDKQWYVANKEKMLEQMKQWREANSEYDKQYYQANKEKILEQKKQYNKTQMGRARYLVRAYTQSDKKANRGECTLTAKWIVNNIFTSKCHYCEESDWTKLGCDRKDNSLPHTEDNVVCCCEDCNKKRGSKSYEEFINEIR